MPSLEERSERFVRIIIQNYHPKHGDHHFNSLEEPFGAVPLAPNGGLVGVLKWKPNDPHRLRDCLSSRWVQWRRFCFHPKRGDCRSRGWWLTGRELVPQGGNSAVQETDIAVNSTEEWPPKNLGQSRSLRFSECLERSWVSAFRFRASLSGNDLSGAAKDFLIFVDVRCQ